MEIREITIKIFAILSMVSYSGCGLFNDNQPCIKITNYSNKEIRVHNYPDTTTWFPDSVMNLSYVTASIEPCTYNFFTLGDQREEKTYVYILDMDTLQKYGWNKLKNERRYLQRYTLYKSNRDYKRDYSYPPTPDMRMIDMYPKFWENEQYRVCKSINPYVTKPEELE